MSRFLFKWYSNACSICRNKHLQKSFSNPKYFLSFLHSFTSLSSSKVRKEFLLHIFFFLSSLLSFAILPSFISHSIAPSISPSIAPSFLASFLRLYLRPSVVPSLLPFLLPSLRPSLLPSILPSLRLPVRSSVPPFFCPSLSLSLSWIGWRQNCRLHLIWFNLTSSSYSMAPAASLSPLFRSHEDGGVGKRRREVVSASPSSIIRLLVV